MPPVIATSGGDDWPVKVAGELSSCGHRCFLIEVCVSLCSAFITGACWLLLHQSFCFMFYFQYDVVLMFGKRFF